MGVQQDDLYVEYEMFVLSEAGTAPESSLTHRSHGGHQAGVSRVASKVLITIQFNDYIIRGCNQNCNLVFCAKFPIDTVFDP